MTGDEIPDSDYVSRYCGGSQIDEDGIVDGAAFRPREGEKYLSVNWLDFLQLSNREDQINKIRNVLSSKLDCGSKAGIAVLNVGETINYVAGKSLDKRKLRVLHEPDDPDDPSHSGIFNFTHDDDLIADIIAETVLDVYSAIGNPR